MPRIRRRALFAAPVLLALTPDVFAADSFRWLGEASWDRGAAWTLEMEMRARRVS